MNRPAKPLPPKAHPVQCLLSLLLVLAWMAGSVAGQVRPDALQIYRAEAPQYARSFRTADGTIYVLGPFKTRNAGKTLSLCSSADPPWGTLLRESAMNTLFSGNGLFFALRNKVVCDADGQCIGKMFRSSDGLKSFQEAETRVIIPEAGKVDNGSSGEWSGLFFHRTVVELRDGSLLATMYGNFEQDTIVPTNPRSKSETKYKLRTFVVRSIDHGQTWRYWSTVAVPNPTVVDDSEGFNEWSIVRLADGRLLGVIRTGHYTPLVVTWSADDGKTWTKPIAPAGLTPGGDPYVILLKDGRLALSYGEIVQPKGPREDYWKEYDQRADQRRRCVLAIDADGSGREWAGHTVADYGVRSAYATIFEVEPNTIVYQADLDVWRIGLPSKRRPNNDGR